MTANNSSHTTRRSSLSGQLAIDFESQTARSTGLLEDAERRLLSHICEGRENAISVSRLMDLCGMSDVMVRQTVKHLVEEHCCLIVSATGSPSGFYFPADREEFSRGVSQYVHRIASLARRVRAMDRAAYEKIFGQRKIEELEDAATENTEQHRNFP